MKPTSGDYALALRAQAGDRTALGELVERTRHRLFALAYAEMHNYDDAHDAVATTFVQVCLHIQELREPERILVWMQSIVRNEVRRLRRDARTPVRLSLEEADAPCEDLGRTLLRLDIERALRQLPPSQADALRLFYLADRSVREIAQQTGGTEGTVKMWLHRGRRQLAAEMKGYAPMATAKTAEPQETAVTRTAAIVHSDLDPALIEKLRRAMQAGGYAVDVLTPDDLGDLNRRAVDMVERIQGCNLLVLDEQIGGRSSFEYILNLRANGETKDIPICLLRPAHLDMFAGIAFFTAGVDRLLDKTNEEQIARFADPFQSERNFSWSRFTDHARQAVYLAEREGVRWQGNLVSTEHLLLGLVHDDLGREQPIVVANRILEERFGLIRQRIREETEKQMRSGSGHHEGQEMQLTQRGKRIIDLAYDEARLLGSEHIGTEHLLLGMLREGEGVAARVLISLGVDPERARQAARDYQQG